MVSHLRSARSTETATSLARNQKRKRGLAHEDEEIRETSLGPVNVYNPRQEGRLGKRFDILHPRASLKAELRLCSPSETYRSRSPMSRDSILNQNVVREPHILAYLIPSHSKIVRNPETQHQIGYPMFSGL